MSIFFLKFFNYEVPAIPHAVCSQTGNTTKAGRISTS